MYFMEDDDLRKLEMLMRSIPNFSPPGHGVILFCSSASDNDHCGDDADRKRDSGCRPECRAGLDERIEAGEAAYREVLTETMSSIRYPPFTTRLNQYLMESEERPMDFKNEQHRKVFSEAVLKLDQKNYALMAALYLLTADWKVWNTAKRYVEKNTIRFECFRLTGGTVGGYSLYCAAKDLYLGTRNLTIGDLADTDLIPPKIFGLICNGMAIRRFGLGAIKWRQAAEGSMQS